MQGDLNLNIAEAHAFNTTDRFTLDVFVVNGWSNGSVEELEEVLSQRLQVAQCSYESTVTLGFAPLSDCGPRRSPSQTRSQPCDRRAGAASARRASRGLGRQPRRRGIWRAPLPHRF